MSDAGRFYDGCAAFYDGDYEAAGYLDDVPFYIEVARRAGGPVLELGCGTGRVLLEIARAGIEIVGVDASAGMLARLRERLAAEPEAVQRRVRVVAGDVRTVRLGERFPLIVSPFRVVQHLIELADQRAWLATVARHLAPGGELVFDVFQPDYQMIAEGEMTAVDVERIDPDTGRTVRRVSRAVHHPEAQTFEVTFEWLVEGEDGEETPRSATTTITRWFTRGELECLLALEGFEIVDLWGDFAGTPFGPGAEDIILRARRSVASIHNPSLPDS